METKMGIKDLPESERQRADCTVVALAIASDIPYSKALEVMKKFGRKDNGCSYKTKKKVTRIFKEVGLKATQVKRSGTLDKFLRQFPKGVYYCLKRGHAFVVIDGKAENQTEGCLIKGAWKIENDALCEGDESNE